MVLDILSITIKWSTIRIVVGIAMLLLFLPAGSANEGPPPALLEIDGNQQSAGIGDSCWKGLCADTFDKITPTEPLHVKSPFTAYLSLPLQPPNKASFIVTQVTDDNELYANGNSARVWRFEWTEGDWHNLPLERESDINLSLEPGLYVLSVFVKWQEQGDVFYGFLVQVDDPKEKITNSSEKIAVFEVFLVITAFLLVITIWRNLKK